MSRIRANKITNKIGTGAVELEKGAHLPIGMGITGAGGLNISGVVTATSFSGSGAALTGIDATTLKDPAGNTKIQAQASGAIHTGIHTFTTFNSTTSTVSSYLDVGTNIKLGQAGVITATSGNFTGNVSIGGTLTYEDVTNIDSVGIVTAREGIFIPDNKKLELGNASGSGDLRLYHDGTHSYIQATGGTGNTIVKTGSNGFVTNSGSFYLKSADNSTTILSGIANGAVTAYFNTAKKFETTSSGVTVTGTVTATAYTGDGSGLSGITVGLTTEALVKTNGQTATLNLTKDDHKVTATGTVTIDVTGGTEGNSHSLRIENSGTASIGFSTYFKFPSGATPSIPTTSGAISLISFTVHKAGSVGIATVLLAGASVNFS